MHSHSSDQCTTYSCLHDCRMCAFAMSSGGCTVVTCAFMCHVTRSALLTPNTSLRIACTCCCVTHTRHSMIWHHNMSLHVAAASWHGMSCRVMSCHVHVTHAGQALIAIHDDLSIVGPYTQAFAAFQCFSDLLARRGDLQLQPHKCRVLIPSDSQQAHTAVTALAAPHGMTVHQGSIALHGGCVGSDETLMWRKLA